MREMYLITVMCSEACMFVRRMFGTREEVKAKLAELIDEATKDDAGNPGIEDIYEELNYVGDENGFHGFIDFAGHGFIDFAGFSIQYYAYPIKDIPLVSIPVDTDKVMDAQTVVNKGFIETDSFSLTGFDEDEGFWERTVPAGTYEFRILDVRGWRPHQILVDDKWIDIAGNEALIDSIQNQIKESGVEV